MIPDLLIRSARLQQPPAPLFDIAIRDNRIVEIAPHIAADCRTVAVDGKLVTPGYVETHIHLDKSCIWERSSMPLAGLPNVIAESARLKRAFTVEDIERRAAHTIEMAIVAGTQFMRTHVEVDPRIGLAGFDAVKSIARRYAWAIDIEICAFPQEGLTNDPGCEETLEAACEAGADLVGGCPYADSDPITHIDRIFRIASKYDLDIDFHLDFHLDPSAMTIGEVCRRTRDHRYEGRVTVGHVTALSALRAPLLAAAASDLRDSGVALTVLPATDLYLMGRGHDHLVPRGVAPAHDLMRNGVVCSIATNNVLNLFTPFGDCSLCRMANLFANIAQLGSREDFEQCMAMISSSAAKIMRLEKYGVSVGNRADLIVLPAQSLAQALAVVAQPMVGIKRGRITFERPAVVLHRE